MAERFFGYCNRVMDLKQHLDSVRDARVGPEYSLQSGLSKVIACVVTAVPSFNQMEKVIKEGTLDKVGGCTTPTADTLSSTVAAANLGDTVAINDAFITKGRRNKSLEQTTVEGYRVVAMDGSGLFSTVSTRLGEKACHYRKDVHGETTTRKQYLAHTLCVSYVGGSGPKPILALVPIPPGKGETTVAKETLVDLHQRHWRYCDIVTLDSLYAKAPVLNPILDQNKDFVVRVKQENFLIIQDANGLFDQRQPDEVHTRIRRGEKHVYYDLEIWDEEEFTSWAKVQRPLRVLRIRVTRTKEKADGTVLKTETYTTHLVTSCPKATVPGLVIWKIAHKRWDIENTGFHFLKNHFCLEHAYGYDESVIAGMLALFALAYNLFQLFVRRNLRSFDAKADTLLEVIRCIHDGLVELRVRSRAKDLMMRQE